MTNHVSPALNVGIGNWKMFGRLSVFCLELKDVSWSQRSAQSYTIRRIVDKLTYFKCISKNVRLSKSQLKLFSQINWNSFHNASEHVKWCVANASFWLWHQHSSHPVAIAFNINTDLNIRTTFQCWNKKWVQMLNASCGIGYRLDKPWTWRFASPSVTFPTKPSSLGKAQQIPENRFSIV